MAGVASLHEVGLFHGDLKISNLVITSSNHLFVTDLATFKPLFIFEDDLNTFN